ncbi:hypothetical protein HZS_749 [Henneguya salminicola]|nr:hypothetical protein HZS_749 [Henneguya salminicola]
MMEKDLLFSQHLSELQRLLGFILLDSPLNFLSVIFYSWRILQYINSMCFCVNVAKN